MLPVSLEPLMNMNVVAYEYECGGGYARGATQHRLVVGHVVATVWDGVGAVMAFALSLGEFGATLNSLPAPGKEIGRAHV